MSSKKEVRKDRENKVVFKIRQQQSDTHKIDSSEFDIKDGTTRLRNTRIRCIRQKCPIVSSMR